MANLVSRSLCWMAVVAPLGSHLAQAQEYSVVVFGYEVPYLLHTSNSVTEAALDLFTAKQSNGSIKFEKVTLGGSKLAPHLCDDVEANVHMVAEYYYRNAALSGKNIIILSPG